MTPTKIVITYPPDRDGELHIKVSESDYTFGYEFRHTKSGDAFDTLLAAAKGIIAQALRLKKYSTGTVSSKLVLEQTLSEIIRNSRREPAELHPLFETLINHFGTRRVLMSLLDLIGKRRWTLESFDPSLRSSETENEENEGEGKR